MRKKRALNEFEFVEKKENGKAQEELGKGAFGRVRLAIDKLTDTKVAIKTVRQYIIIDP
jgi:serine/threonine protein kinase